MAKFTQPTKNSIAQDGLKLAGYPSGGTSAQQSEAEGWIEEAKMDLWNEMNKYKVKLKALLVTSYGVTTAAISRYANPSDCDEIYSVSICDATHTGTATAVAAGSVTLAADEDVTDDVAEGKWLLLTSGTGVGNCSQISDYNESTKVVTLTPNFQGSSFDGTENYMIIDTTHELRKRDPKEYDEIDDPFEKEEPTEWFPQGQGSADADETGEFELYPVPDDTYGIKLRYYMNITLLDLTNDANLIGTLYRKFKPLFTQKVIYRRLQKDRNWENLNTERNLYYQMLYSFVEQAKDVGYVPTPERMYY